MQAFRALTLLVGQQEGHPACGVVFCLERRANDLHMVQLMPLSPHHVLLHENPEWFIFLVPAYPSCPGKRPLNGCSNSSSVIHHHNRFSALFQDHPGEPVPEENFETLWCKGRLTEADTPSIRLGATTSGLTNAHLHHPARTTWVSRHQKDKPFSILVKQIFRYLLGY